MKTIVHQIALFSASFFLLSCATQRLATVSGRPEVTVKPPISRAQGIAIETMMADGFTVAGETSSTLVFEKDLPQTQSAIMLAGVGSPYHSQPKAVVRYVFVEQGDSVKILGTVQASTQGPFGQVRIMDITSGRSALQLQGSLERIKQRVEQQ